MNTRDRVRILSDLQDVRDERHEAERKMSAAADAIHGLPLVSGQLAEDFLSAYLKSSPAVLACEHRRVDLEAELAAVECAELKTRVDCHLRAEGLVGHEKTP